MGSTGNQRVGPIGGKIGTMRVLVVGGSGYIGRFLVPPLARRHPIRVFDRQPPPDPADDTEYAAGDATDYDALRAAMVDVDAVIHCAMGDIDWTVPAGAADAFDVNVKSVHLTLLAAHDAGVGHAVYMSSLSIYRDLMSRSFDETEPPDATDLYGLTKRLGEQVCAAAVAEWGLSVNILRLAWPTADEDWPAWSRLGAPELLRTPDGTLVQPTAASDLARAVLAALELRDGCQAFTISGDGPARRWSTDKARRLLGWQPERR